MCQTHSSKTFLGVPVTKWDLLDYGDESMKKSIAIILTALTSSSFAQENVSADSDACVFVADQMPRYPGGLESLSAFIKSNLTYPKGATHYEGAVYVAFIINKDGSATEFKILRGLCDVCDKNAIEVLEKMPKWIPGTVKEKPVRTRMVLPV